MAAKNSLPDSAITISEITIGRLKNRADFLKCRNGARSHERAFVLQLIRREENSGDSLRIGYTVTKKVGNAVERNRIKRRLREAVKQVPLPSTVSGHDAVFIARREALSRPFDDLVGDVVHGFSHASRSRDKRNIANSARAGQKRRGGE